MADIVVGDAQFAQVAEQRPHDERYISEVIMQGGVADIDLGEYILFDILGGNTKNIRQFRRKAGIYNLALRVLNGTTDSHAPLHGEIDLDFMPIITLKDDSHPDGYYKLPRSDPAYFGPKRVLDSIGIDMDEISEQLIDPEDPGTGPTDPAFRKYAQAWRHSDQLKEEYPTIDAYYTKVHEDWVSGRQDMNKQTDVNIGMFTSVKFLDEASSIAWYFSMLEFLPRITYNGPQGDSFPARPEFPPTSYMYEVSPASNMEAMTFVTGFSDWQHWIRSGDIRTSGRKRKYDASVDVIHLFHDGLSDIEFMLLPDPTHGDPVIEQRKNIMSYDIYGISALRVRVQLTRGANPTYGEIVLYEPETLHALTGRGKAVQVLGTLRRWYDGGELKYAGLISTNLVPPRTDDDYSDIVLFPLTKNGMRKVPLFRRERLIREVTIVSVSYIDIIKTKWYQSRWFSVVLFVVSIVLAALTDGASVPFTEALFMSAITATVAMLAMMLINDIVDNPLLSAILRVAMLVILKQYSLDNFMQMAQLAVEATNTYTAKALALEFEEKQEELRKQQREQRDAMAELEKEEIEAGIISPWGFDNMETWSSFPLVESTKDSYERTGNEDYSIVDDVTGLDDIKNMIKTW